MENIESYQSLLEGSYDFLLTMDTQDIEPLITLDDFTGIYYAEFQAKRF